MKIFHVLQQGEVLEHIIQNSQTSFSTQIHLCSRVRMIPLTEKGRSSPKYEYLVFIFWLEYCDLSCSWICHQDSRERSRCVQHKLRG